jgi:hypothetical protein
MTIDFQIENHVLEKWTKSEVAIQEPQTETPKNEDQLNMHRTRSTKRSNVLLFESLDDALLMVDAKSVELVYSEMKRRSKHELLAGSSSSSSSTRRHVTPTSGSSSVVATASSATLTGKLGIDNRSQHVVSSRRRTSSMQKGASSSSSSSTSRMIVTRHKSSTSRLLRQQQQQQQQKTPSETTTISIRISDETGNVEEQTRVTSRMENSNGRPLEVDRQKLSSRPSGHKSSRHSATSTTSATSSELNPIFIQTLLKETKMKVLSASFCHSFS